MKFEVRNPISGITVQFVSSGHISGSGTLAATGVSTLTWKAPGSITAGAAVTIANGESKVLYDGVTTTLYILVTRTSATDLVVSSAIVLVTPGSTTAELLAAVDAAILQCLAAQQEGVGDAYVRRSELAELRAYKSELEAKLALENGTTAHVASADLRGNFT